jgi:hypothetical protein
VVPTEGLSPEGTPSKKIRPADARAVVPGTHFPDDPEIHLEKQKKIWVKGRASHKSVFGLLSFGKNVVSSAME